MRSAGVFLTARVEGSRQRILDPLGLDAAGATIVRRHLLPGITAGLRHARYFSFMTWIAGTFADSRTRLEWPVYRRRLEQAIRIACRYANPGVVGIVGADITPDITEVRASALVELDLDAPSSYEAQYYGASFGAINLAIRHRGATPVLRPLGVALYMALEECIGSSSAEAANAFDRLRNAPRQLSVRELIAISSIVNFEPIEPSSPEFEPLVSAIVGLDQDNALGSRDGNVRARVFSLILSVIAEASRSITSQHISQALTGPKLPSSLSQRYLEEIEAWRCFGDRQAQRLVFGGIWSVLLDWIRSATLDGIEHDELVGRAISLIEGGAENLSQLRWSEFEGAVATRMGKSRKQRFEFREQLVDDLLEHFGKQTVPSERRLRLALELAAECSISWKLDDRSADFFTNELHNFGGTARMSVAWLINELELRRDHTVESILEWLIDRCVLEQLQLVGYSKQRGSEALLVAWEGDRVLMTRPHAKIDPLALDTSRLDGALRLMEGLSLLESDSGEYQITEAGRRVVRLVEADSH